MSLNKDFPDSISPEGGFLIIGYGNELRCDDAAGQWVARAVADWHLPFVQSRAIHQLTPELAADIAAVRYVIFIDACHHYCTQTIQLDPLVISRHPYHETPQAALALDTHHSTPASLLALTQFLYGHCPQVWLLQIPAECFDLGNQLSSTTRRGCDRALRTIEQFFQTYHRPRHLSRVNQHDELCMKSA